MAEQPIKGSDVIDPKFLDDAIKKAEEFLVINKELTGVLSENLKITSNSLRSAKSDTSTGIKLQAQLTKQAADELKALEVLKQQELKTEQALANVRAASERAAKAQIATENARINQAKQTAKETQTVTVAYDNLRKKYNDLSRAQIELSVRGREGGKVFKGIQDEALKLRAALDKAEQGAGRFQRNVGNYASTFNGLGNSVNQLTRELPAFAVSANTGFLAISNNLPIFFDQLQRINAENAILIKQGKPVESTLKQVTSAVFSVGTALSLAVTLLTLFGGTIIKTISSLFSQKDAFELNEEAMAAYTEEIQRTIDKQADLDKSIGTLQKAIIRNKNLISEAGSAQLEAIDQLGDKYAQNEKERLKGVSKIIVEQLKAGDKEVEIATRVLKDTIEIENTKTGEIIRLDRQAKNVLTQFSGFYNKKIQTLNEKAIQDKLNLLNKETKIFEQKLDDEYTLAVENTFSTEDAKNKIRQKYSDEDYLQQKSVRDKIRQLYIDQTPDEEQRRVEQIAFDRDKALEEIDIANKTELVKKQIAKRNYENERQLILANVKDVRQQNIDLIKLREDYTKEVKQIEADNISKEEQTDLRLAIEIDANNKILAVRKEFYDKQDELNKENAIKTQEARRKIEQDNLNFEIYQLEKTYTDKQKTVSYFNLLEINNLERQISAKKIAQIKADAEEKAALTKNEAEKLAIMNEANIAIEKENQKGEEQINANRKAALDKAIKFEIKILDAVAKAEAEKSKLRVEGFDRLISDTEKNIEHQRRLAENGKANTLAFEEEQKRKNELLREQEKQKELKRQKAIAFFKMFSELVGQGKQPAAALGEAAATTYAADAIAGSFIKGTENVERDLKGSKVHNGTDGYVIAVDGKERILNPEQNTKVGALSNEELADLAYRHNNGLLDASLVKMSAYPQNDFAKNVQDSALLMQTMKLNENITDLKDIIKNRPVPSFKVDSLGNVIENIYQNGTTKIIKHINSKKRI